MSGYYEVRQVAGILNRHPRTIYRWLDEGFINGKKLKGRYLIPKKEVDRILSEAAGPQDKYGMTEGDIP
ncbi:MAG: helix-turn-helix domain-containing protein [Desulfobacterales bacterium]|jgi:excisionase family DNA binding protein